MEDRLATLQRRHLGKRLFVVFWRKVPGITNEQMRALLPGHLEFLDDLETRGILFASGPLQPEEDAADPALHGMTILRADTAAEAAALITEEPFRKAGYRTAQIVRWTLNEGSFSVRLRFGTASYEVL